MSTFTKVKRVYIAGPMRGYPDFNFPAFHEAATRWRAWGWSVVNPAENFGGDQTRTYAEYMRKDIADILTCTDVAFLPGWEKSQGATLEHHIAKDLGLELWNAVDGSPLVDQWPMPTDSKATNPKDAIGCDKLPFHLWPETASAMGSLGLLEGMLKYGRSNWRAAGVRASIYFDAARRHLNAWFEGEDNAPDSGLPHVAHALACLAIVVDAKAAGMLYDDRQIRGGYRALIEELTPEVKRLKDKYSDRSPKHYTIADSGVTE